jgi:hypothetical protein
MMRLCGKVIGKKYKFFFASLKSMEKVVGSGVGTGSATKCHGSPTLIFFPNLLEAI